MKRLRHSLFCHMRYFLFYRQYWWKVIDPKVNMWEFKCTSCGYKVKVR